MESSTPPITPTPADDIPAMAAGVLAAGAKLPPVADESTLGRLSSAARTVDPAELEELKPRKAETILGEIAEIEQERTKAFEALDRANNRIHEADAKLAPLAAELELAIAKATSSS